MRYLFWEARRPMLTRKFAGVRCLGTAGWVTLPVTQAIETKLGFTYNMTVYEANEFLKNVHYHSDVLVVWYQDAISDAIKFAVLCDYPCDWLSLPQVTIHPPDWFDPIEEPPATHWKDLLFHG